MSGPRNIRRPGAAPARPASARARRTREKDEGRGVQRKVLATGAAILLAGTSATFLLEQAVLAPRRQVRAESSLPVYSAVGQRTDDVSFWPWIFYAEQAGQTPTLFPMEGDAYTAEMLVTLVDALLGGGVEMETSSLVTESYTAARSSCLYLRDLPVLWTPPDGGEAKNLTLNMAYGGGSDPALTFGMAMSFVLKSEETPTEAQLEAAYRQVLLDLWFQCGAVGWLMDSATASEVISATSAPADVASEPEETPASQPLGTEDGSLSDEALRRLQASARLPIESLLDRLAAPLTEALATDFFLQWPAGLGPDTSLWPPENSPDPAALAGGTMSETDIHKLEQRLQQQYAEYGMELQVVTLSDSVLVLFSGGGSTMGLYYDPVLEKWSGIAIQ